MPKIELPEALSQQLAPLDEAIARLNAQKIKHILDALGIYPKPEDLERLLEWDLITVTVPDKQMAVQLNKLCTYVPNLKFSVDADKALFTVLVGKGKRVWKGR
ncbi:hypothetical protein HUK80_12595 [Flavobacterium sp. MAH-1]|uniref:Uncharacterized protein n=1 Tax=Flavobacterium agri TaxID=2743471 RepID=A0A7Y9C7T9_9FLAO|nr:hypothetical protein [Flavobacterium agri]NUY81739.1 hypothetical protein [Flavobacterium agri]NYA71763.1 hypothetical protein [Flavobacterium agri]